MSELEDVIKKNLELEIAWIETVQKKIDNIDTRLKNVERCILFLMEELKGLKHDKK